MGTTSNAGLAGLAAALDAAHHASHFTQSNSAISDHSLRYLLPLDACHRSNLIHRHSIFAIEVFTWYRALLCNRSYQSSVLQIYNKQQLLKYFIFGGNGKPSTFTK
jgi:hypothetical protein